MSVVGGVAITVATVVFGRSKVL